MSALLRLAALFSLLFLATGCETVKKIVSNERDNRGGYADRVSDRFLIANTNEMRVLRGYAVAAAMSGLALETGLDDDDRVIAAGRIEATMRHLKRAHTCALKHPDCIYIDTRMFEVNKSMFLLAKTILPIDQLKELIDVSSLGISTIRSLLRIGGRAIKGGLRVAAVYRDTWDLYMNVYIDYLEGRLIDTAGTNDAQFYQETLTQVQDLYREGSGDLRKWKTNLRDFKVQGSRYERLSHEVVPEQKHFDTVVVEIFSNCKRLAEAIDETACDF